MGRELRRVPLDFDWPMKKTWHGFLNPYYSECPHCNRGQTLGRTRLEALLRLLALSASDAKHGENHPYFHNMPGLHMEEHEKPSKDLAELWEAITGEEISIMGARGEWTIEKKLIEMAGFDPEKWGICEKCEGSGIHPDLKEQYDAWKETPVPKGDGYQMWETTSEGSPISPVFKTGEELARWLASTNASSFGNAGATYDEWLQMINSTGWAPSAIVSGGVMKSGVAGLADAK